MLDLLNPISTINLLSKKHRVPKCIYTKPPIYNASTTVRCPERPIELWCDACSRLQRIEMNADIEKLEVEVSQGRLGRVRF